MADLQLYIDDDFCLDIALDDNDFSTDNSLTTSVLLSLLSYRFDGITKLNSWFAEDVLLTDIPQGSRLYKLLDENNTSSARNRAKQYVNEALQWLIDDNIANDINVEIVNESKNKILINIVITRPSETDENYSFFINWESQQLGALNV